MQQAVTGEAPLGPRRPMPNRPKGRFNRIRGAHTRPMRGRKRVERQEILLDLPALFCYSHSSWRLSFL